MRRCASVIIKPVAVKITSNRKIRVCQKAGIISIELVTSSFHNSNEHITLNQLREGIQVYEILLQSLLLK